MEDLNVVCLKWGTKFPPEYVNNLYRGVRRHLARPHRFVCLTEDPRGLDPGVEIRPLVEDLPGWWNKLALFKPQVHDLTGTILFFDLDMVVLRDLEALAGHPGDFLAVKATYQNTEYWTNLMRFPVGGYARIWELFEPRSAEVVREIRSDQDWINACAGEAELINPQSVKARRLWPEVAPAACQIEPLPRHWFPSFKRDLEGREDRLQPEARVLVFHGLPMVHEVDWVSRYWNGGGEGG